MSHKDGNSIKEKYYVCVWGVGEENEEVEEESFPTSPKFHSFTWRATLRF